MRTSQLGRGITAGVAVLLAIALGPGHGRAPDPAPALSAADVSTATGTLTLVQAAPGMSTEVSVDGRSVRRDATSGDVIGPLRLPTGTHQVGFASAGDTSPAVSTVRVGDGTASDVVLHFPAAKGGAPVLTSYETPMGPIGPGKARLLLAHTATVAPADVRFDGRTVFRNIANGEFAEADVPEGRHRVALLPTGQTAPALLGPLPVRLAPRTVTMVYAVGDPQVGSMDVVTHVVDLGDAGETGDAVPDQIRTGSAGLVSDVRVRPFGR